MPANPTVINFLGKTPAQKAEREQGSLLPSPANADVSKLTPIQ